MNLLKNIFENEVFPAIGCTEPISCAYTAAAAVELLGAPAQKITLFVDPGTYKNGAAVTVPNSGGAKGNAIAAALGAAIAKSSLRLEILKDVSPEVLNNANALIASGKLQYCCKEDEKEFHVEVEAAGGGSVVRCVVAEGHTNIVKLEKDGKSIIEKHPHAGSREKGYKDIMREMKLEDVLKHVINMDAEDRAYIQRGIDMNIAVSLKGIDMKRTAYQLKHMMKEGIMANDLSYRVKLAVASAVDARMGGMPEPVMTSGGSGNQGSLTILVPYIVGRHQDIEIDRIVESIAISHAVNSYVKCFMGELSVICGCAIAASISAAIALVYQNAGIDMKKIGFAIDNVIGDLCGIICDGAKPGCSMKIMSGAETAIRSAYMALAGYGLSETDGVLGCSPEESIKNLCRVSFEGMGLVDPTVVHILQDKSVRSGMA